MNTELKTAFSWAEEELQGISHGSVTLRFVKHDNRLQYVDRAFEIKEKIKASEARLPYEKINR